MSVAARHLGVTTEGRSACSARQLVASIVGSTKNLRSAGNSIAAALHGIPMLTVGREVAPLARTLLRGGALPAKARIDAVHVAIAATNGIDYLLTWNMRHLANAVIRGKIEERCRKAGVRPPIICTPEELMEVP